MITQIEEQQNIMAEMLQEIQEKDEKLMCFQEQGSIGFTLTDSFHHFLPSTAHQLFCTGFI